MLQIAESTLPLLLEEFRDGPAGALFDLCVRIIEGAAQGLCHRLPHGTLPASRHAGEDNVCNLGRYLPAHRVQFLLRYRRAGKQFPRPLGLGNQHAQPVGMGDTQLRRLEQQGRLDNLSKTRADKGYEDVAYPRTINIRG